MSINIFVYIILYNLYNRGIYSISINELIDVYEDFKNICETYNNKIGVQLTQNIKTFIKTIIFVFYKNELGTYINENLTYFPKDLMYKNIYKQAIVSNPYNIENIKIANELSYYLYLFIIENKNLKK